MKAGGCVPSKNDLTEGEEEKGMMGLLKNPPSRSEPSEGEHNLQVPYIIDVETSALRSFGKMGRLPISIVQDRWPCLESASCRAHLPANEAEIGNRPDFSAVLPPGMNCPNRNKRQPARAVRGFFNSPNTPGVLSTIEKRGFCFR